MSDTTDTSGTKIVNFSLQQYEYLKRIFPVEPILPDDKMAKIQYRAGQQSIIDWVETRIKSV